jgi:hypothetical protein
MVSDPFHLRLQGKYDSFDDGAGIAFHPGANGVLTPQDQRLAFVGSASGNIEVVDIAYYIRRARLQLKNSIYGPLRVSLPTSTYADPAVILVLAISQQGLVDRPDGERHCLTSKNERPRERRGPRTEGRALEIHGMILRFTTAGECMGRPS